MDFEKKEKIEKRMKEGWIKAVATFEVVAVSAEKAESAVKGHIERMSKEDGVFVYRADFHESRETKSPVQGIDKAFSAFCEAELLANNFETLINLTMFYGPSSLEIIEPLKLKVSLPEAQNIVNNISELLHRYAAAGLGGVVIRT